MDTKVTKAEKELWKANRETYCHMSVCKNGYYMEMAVDFDEKYGVYDYARYTIYDSADKSNVICDSYKIRKYSDSSVYRNGKKYFGDSKYIMEMINSAVENRKSWIYSQYKKMLRENIMAAFEETVMGAFEKWMDKCKKIGVGKIYVDGDGYDRDDYDEATISMTIPNENGNNERFHDIYFTDICDTIIEHIKK